MDTASRDSLDRLVVVGTSCSGKTTFAGQLASRLGSPHIELDALYWGPGWVQRPDEDFRAAVLEGIAGDRWIVDGNYSRVRDMVWARATGIVWLNYPFPLVFARAFVRTLRRAVRRERLYSDNRESLRKAFFTRESILWWVITSHRRRRLQYRELIDGGTLGHLVVHEFARPREAEAFLSSIEALR